MRKILIFLFSFTLLLDPANAATKKATPTPTKKVTAKASAKATAKSTTKASAKPTAKSTTTKKPVPKKVYKPRPRKTVKLTPSPSPKWPPKGYSQNGDIYAKVPTKKELYSYSRSEEHTSELQSH